MRFFFIAFLVITGISGYFWLVDQPGSGLAYPTCFFGALGLGTGIYNWSRYGSPLAEGPQE